MARMRHKWNQLERVATAIASTPAEIVRRLIGKRYHTRRGIFYRCMTTGRTMTVPKGYEYDCFTYAPNLRDHNGKHSEAAAIHDWGWDHASWDDSTRLTFDENNENFRRVLERENHPRWVVNLYCWGVMREFMRRAWEAQHGPDVDDKTVMRIPPPEFC